MPSLRSRLMRTSSSGRSSTAEDSSQPVTHWHVLSERGVEVRSSPEASSPVLARLDRGTPLTSDRRQDKAIHVVVPIEGWVDETCPSDNHVLCATGDATMSARWRYRVVCSDGAYVRGGLELSSPHIYTLAHQAIMEVHERRVNEQGLARLRTDDGWISEHLNPLSGQRGPIVELVPVVANLKYRVVLQEGAVVRETVELSSPIVKVIQCGETMTISGKQFSNHPAQARARRAFRAIFARARARARPASQPASQPLEPLPAPPRFGVQHCVPRLKLEDGSGWISQRLNREPPDDLPVVELIAAEAPLPPREEDLQRSSSSPAPHDAAGAKDETPGVSARSSNDVEAVACAIMSVRGQQIPNGAPMDTQCVICLSAGRNATIVHGETGHIACCLECARVLKARGDTCPVCRMEVDAVICHFWA